MPNKEGKEGLLQCGLRLLVIALIGGLLLGGVYAITIGPIQKQAQEWEKKSIQKVFPTQRYEVVKNVPDLQDNRIKVMKVYRAFDGDRVMGCVVLLTSRGYGGEINLTVGIDLNGKIVGVDKGANNETPGIGSKALSATYLSKYQGIIAEKTSLGSGENQVDAISSVTITSTAVNKGIRAAGRIAKQVNQP